METEIRKTNWFRKHWIISIFLGLIILGIISNGFNNFAEDNNDLTGNLIQEQIEDFSQEEIKSCIPNWQCSSWSECSSSKTQTRTCIDANKCERSIDTTESQSCTYSFKLGNKVIVGDIAYTLHSKTEKSEIGKYYGYGDYESFLGEKADGIFYIFDITIENIGKESVTFWQTNVKIYDMEGRTFDPDTTAQIYLDDSFGYDQLQPGLPKRGKLAFDVPQGLNGKLELSNTNLLSNQKEYVSWN